MYPPILWTIIIPPDQNHANTQNRQKSTMSDTYPVVNCIPDRALKQKLFSEKFTKTKKLQKISFFVVFYLIFSILQDSIL